MQKVNSTIRLKNRIQLLEDEQAINLRLLREQFYITYDSLRPVNLLLSTLKDLTSSPLLIDSMSGTVIGLASGYLSKKIVVGASGNLIRKLIGSIIQYGVTNFAAKNSDSIKSVGLALLKKFLSKKEHNS